MYHCVMIDEDIQYFIFQMLQRKKINSQNHSSYKLITKMIRLQTKLTLEIFSLTILYSSYSAFCSIPVTKNKAV